MRLLSAILVLMVCVPESPAQSNHDSKPAPFPGLVAEHLYNGVNRPCIVIVTSPRSFGTVTLSLMDQFGIPLASKVQVHPGRVDLAEVLPDGILWNLDRAAYLQLLDGDQPVGSALVLQPMLSRMVPKTQTAVRPNGATYTRIIGWVDENQPPPPEATPTTAPAAPPPPPPVNTLGNPNMPAGAGNTTATPIESSNQQSAISGQPQQTANASGAPAPVKRIFAGLRIWPETDVILHTIKGDIRVALRPDEAPNTAWNFLELSRGGFYRDIPFHRVVPLNASGQPFVIQAGDPSMNDAGLATGDGGPGFWLPIEDSHLPHDFGVISMARNDDPDSNGSQFFFALSREGCARLDGQYCSFGYAVDGAETIKSIAEVELANIAEGRPANPPLIKDAELVLAPPRMPGAGRPDARVTVEGPAQVETRPARVPR